MFDYLIVCLHLILPKRMLTAIAGYFADIRLPFVKNALIDLFIRAYKINMKEALKENPNQYACFNDFFIRHLKANARPLSDSLIISPVDGYVSEIGYINSGQILQAKNHSYTVDELLATDPSLCKLFENGAFATLYLSPQDYHRVHMPIEATLQQMVYVPGKLFSVQPATTRMTPKLFAQNERVVVFFDTAIGPMAMILVGATIVGKIGVSWEGDIPRSAKVRQSHYEKNSTTLDQGKEMGYFKLGSTVILLFAEKQFFAWSPHLKSGTKIRLGESLIANNTKAV